MTSSTYQSPLSQRYASRAMQEQFSNAKKFSTWRKLWVALAVAEQQLGLDISDEQIAQMRAHLYDINESRANEIESMTRHDVMAHVLAFGEQCPLAKPIIHLGATSMYVCDNADLIIMTEALGMIRDKLVNVIDRLSVFARTHRDLPTLAFTHYQSAQPTTVGKRASLWLMDLLLDLQDIEFRLGNMKLLGSKGTTGTQASFLALFEGDHEKVRQLDTLIAEQMGFDAVYPVSGQTYSRKIDAQVVDVLSGIAQSAHKFSNDIRLLQNMKEVEEPFGDHQIGSSAMPYKRNPMRSERMAALSRYVLANALNTAQTAAEQWLERTLDDSANRRIAIPEAFLAVDGILDLYLNISSGLVVNPRVIEKNLMRELPFMATENILMAAVKRGGDRQVLHGKIRDLSVLAAERVKQGDGVNDMLERIAADPDFGIDLQALESLLNPALYVGRAPEQVDEFLQEQVLPVVKKYEEALGLEADILV